MQKDNFEEKRMSIQYAIRDNSNAIAALNDGEGIAKIDIQRLASVMTSLKGNNNKNGYRTTVTNLNKEINYIYNSLVNNSFLNKENATLLNTYNGFLNGLITKVRTASSINNQVMQNYGVDINFVIENRDKFLHNSDKSDSNKLKVDYVCKNNKEFEKIFNDIKDKYKIKNPKKANFFMFGNNKINGWYKTEKKFDSNIDVSGTTLDDLRNFFDKDYIYCTVSYGKKKHGTSFYELNNEFKDTSFRSEELEILKDRYLFRYVPSQNTIDKILKSFEEIIKENGFEFDSDKAKISAFSLEEFDEINIEIPTSVKKISKKTKKQEFDEIIKEGFRNTGTSFLGHFCSIVDANYGGMPTESDVCYIVQDEDKEEFNKYYNIYKYNGDLKLYNRENLGKYIKNGLEYLFNNNSIEKLNANNANIKAYFNDNCGNFLKDYDSSFVEFNDVNNYYDFYSASTPYVSLTFRYRNNDGIQEVNINSVEYPFIKSFNCVDEGVKTFTIKLFDRDFNSLINIYDDNGNKIGEKTLEQILALSVGINNTKQENDNEEAKYSLTAANYGDVVGTKVSEDMQYNLGIIFGYSETNPKLTQENGTNYLSSNASKNGDYTYAGNTKYYIKDKNLQRTHRWWETSVEESNDHNRTLSDRVNSPNQTTIRTELIETLITGYQTEFSSAGIYYTIKAIEMSQSELSKYKIYQRYTNIKGTPSEVLYTVMNMVNSIFDGKDGGIKLYIDESCRSGKDVVIEDYEKEEESKDEDNVNKIQEPKQVQISLGSKDALSMYQDDLSSGLKEEPFFKNNKKPKLYKSVLSILNDLKAVMPPKVVDSGLMKDAIITDQDGNSVKAIQKQNAYRRFTYGVQTKEGKVEVYFYYQQPTKFERIKKYEWGPANGKHSVITNVDIKTDNEYALLTSMSTITEKGASIISRDGYGTEVLKKRNASYADYIAQPGDSTPLDQIAYAYSQALYKGSITIMGDPFYCFDKFVQPFTYPIYLDFRLPVSQSWSNSSSTNKIGYSHFMSGFYVVTKITHDINDSGFRTILEVMSYPNITNDVLG